MVCFKFSYVSLWGSTIIHLIPDELRIKLSGGKTSNQWVTASAVRNVLCTLSAAGGQQNTTWAL